MYSPSVLIISKRRELAIRYKKILKLMGAEVSLVDNLSDAIGEIKENEFEFIIISDTIEDNIKDFIRNIRVLTYNFRPSVIAISKSDELSDKLALLDAGADDFLSEAMPNKEFKARINAHIRRHIENLVNPNTGFLNETLTKKLLGRIIKKKKQTSFILVKIDNIEHYREVYGEIAAEKVLRTTSAIMSSALTKEDNIGHYREHEFLIFTEDPARAEKLAEFFALAFDNVLSRFYSKHDFINNFMLFSSNSKEEKKVSLMKIREAVLEYSPSNAPKSANEIIQTLLNMLKPLKNAESSTFIIDRPKLNGESGKNKKNKILIMENDEALGLLIETNCVINGYLTKISPSYDEFLDCLEKFSPDLVILDWGYDDKKEGIGALSGMKKYYSKKKQKMPVVIFSTNILDKKTILSKGADFYLPKPYDINLLIKAIDDFLK